MVRHRHCWLYPIVLLAVGIWPLWSTHTELLEPEDLVRGLGFSSAIARAADVDLPRDAKMTDVPCHSWIMPTLLRHAGIDFLHLGCNAASQSPRVPLLFWWEGPDGSRVLTMYVAEGYGTGLLPPDDWPHRTWLALIHTGDNHGPPRPEEVSRLVADAAPTIRAAYEQSLLYGEHTWGGALYWVTHYDSPTTIRCMSPAAHTST